MRQLWILLTFFTTLSWGQKVKVNVHPNSPSQFYEAEYIRIHIELENTTKDSIPLDYWPSVNITKVTDDSGLEVFNENMESYNHITNHSPIKYPPITTKYYPHRFPPKSKIQFGEGIDFFFISNSSFVIGENKKTTRYQFLQAGKYIVHFEVNMDGFSQSYQHPIEILRPEGENLKRYKALGNAIYNTEKLLFASAYEICDSTKATVFKFLLDYKTGPYVTTALEYFINPTNSNAWICFTEKYYTFRFLDLLPTIYKGNEWQSQNLNFYYSIGNKINICFRDYIPNKEEFINGYLKKYELFSPIFSERIIQDASKCCDVSKLINYAALRANKETKSRKSK